MSDERIYAVSAIDAHDDQHIFVSEDRKRAIAVYEKMMILYRNAGGNEALKEALGEKRR